jgi:hypothetical protein
LWARLIDQAPFSQWKNQTFIAGLRHDRMDDLGIDGTINGEIFDLVETQPARTLTPGDVIMPRSQSTWRSERRQSGRTPQPRWLRSVGLPVAGAFALAAFRSIPDTIPSGAHPKTKSAPE